MIIDSDGLFSGSRVRQCSNQGQLHLPRFLLASNGWGRIELDYHRLVARAYASFRPVPNEAEVFALVREYVDTHLLFLYESGGQLWGTWDTRPALLPRYKTAADKRSPAPPEPAYSNWRSAYRTGAIELPKPLANLSRSLPRDFGNSAGGFPPGVGGGDGDGVGHPPSPRDEFGPKTGLLRESLLELAGRAASYLGEDFDPGAMERASTEVVEEAFLDLDARMPMPGGWEDDIGEGTQRDLDAAA